MMKLFYSLETVTLAKVECTAIIGQSTLVDSEAHLGMAPDWRVFRSFGVNPGKKSVQKTSHP